MNDLTAALPADQPALSRSLRPRHVAMITIGGIIGAGLFVGSSVAIAAAGPAIIVSYVLTGLLILLVMRMLGEMAVEMPEVRSFTEFTRAALGNWAGFSIGWLYWYFWVIVIPVEAIAGAGIIQRWLPWPAWQIGTALMLLMTAVNLMSARAYGEFEFWFSSIKVVAIITFIIAVGAYACGYRSPAGPTFSTLTAYGGFAPRGWFAVLAAVTTVIWSMMGAEVVTIAAAESPEPARAVARMTSSIISRIVIFYVGSIFVITCVVPWTEVVAGQSPFTLALDHIHFPYASTFMAAVILTAVLSCLNSSFYIASRVLFVLASRGDAPRWLVRTNKRHVPARAVLLASVVGFAGVIAAILSPSVVFAFLVNSSGAIIAVIYLAIAVSQIRTRKARDAAGSVPALPMWMFPWLSYLAVAGVLAVLIAMAVTPSHRAEFWTSVISMSVALLAYLVFRRPAATVYAAPRAGSPSR
ncbi:MAG: amino acid permease [Gammaproteobacteria bacterium]|nr:amino acid permease [Gammaproteobacteria bacterium]MBV8307369.1 amino acid permease [Gammaproteobacteria bacterium]MBV8403317.1 amino acid permease [Gammaproteobacteria bacterium]